MKIRQKTRRTIWVKDGDVRTIQIIDQRSLPHQFVVEDVRTVGEMAHAIKDMHVRGAPLIGVASAFGMYLATLSVKSEQDFDAVVGQAADQLKATRPTAVNIEYAVTRVLSVLKKQGSLSQRQALTLETAKEMADEDARVCQKIGEFGYEVIQAISKKKNGKRVNILTHCNAGWLACIEWGTATAPIYRAFDEQLDIHVWVDETRPRNQGARLTAWELGERGVPHTVIADSAAGHLMQRGLVDVIFVGTDRTTAAGDVANKIGTYQVALAAKENKVPFYVGAPSSSIDWNLKDGVKQIPIEERSPDEVRLVQGTVDNKIKRVRVTPEKSPALNFAFDVTPRKFVSGLVTERGIAEASEEGLLKLFPEKKVK